MGSPTAPPRSASAARPDRIGRYRIVGELGRGGMGVVYRAEDERLGRPVALKVLPAHLGADPQARERLAVEARAAAALDHPHVCTVYEVGEAEDGRPYIAFACYDGQTLRDRLGEGPLPVPEAVRIAREVASGVAAAHAAGIVHRDLKPSNVFLCEDGTAKVLDFGIARVRDTVLTATGQTPGTVEYGAPETARGRGDARADVWSLGVVLYEMLTARRPFAGDYPAAVLYAILHEEPPPPSALRPDVPPDVDAVVARCLAKEPGDRFPDAAAVAAALAAPEAEVADGVAASLRRAGRAVGRRVRRSRAWQAGAAALVVLAGVGVWQGTRGTDGLPRAIHLAVLPPEPFPDEGETREFADGLAETLASGIVELGAAHIGVMPMSDVREERVESARQAGDRLRANLALTGSLRRDGDRLTLTLNLSTTGSRPRLLASKPLTFADRETHRIREEALRTIAAMLDIEITDAAAGRLGSGTDDPEAEEYLRRGVAYLERNRDAEDVDRAIDLFGQAIEEDPTFAEAHARLGEALLVSYGSTRDAALVEHARAAVEEAERLDPQAPAVHVTLAKLYLATGEYPRAIAHAGRASRLAPASVSAALALADTEAASGDVDGAERTLRALVARDTASWVGRLRLGKFLYEQQRYAEAVDELSAVVRLVPDNFQGHLALGGARLYDGDTPGALAAWEEAYRLRDDHYGVVSNLGLVNQQAGNAREAVRWYRRATDLRPENHTVWNNLASGYSALGDEAGRREALRTALRRAEVDLAVNDSDPDVLASVATYRSELGDRAGALDAARRAAALAPSDPSVQVEAAAAVAAAGERDEAIDLLLTLGRAGYPLDGMDRYDALAPLAADSRIAALRASSPP